MFIADTTTIWIEALKEVFGPDHPIATMRNLSVYTEYPVNEAQYPGLWVQFTPQGDVQNVGIGHVEYTDGSAPGTLRRVYRWKFKGVVEIVIAALGNLERSNMVDEVLKTIAYGHPEDATEISVLRSYIQGNDLIGLLVTWDSVQVGGFAESQGSPWGGDEVIYEGTVSISIEGEVAFDPVGGNLVPLAQVKIDPMIQDVDPDIDPTGVDGAWR